LLLQSAGVLPGLHGLDRLIRRIELRRRLFAGITDDVRP